MMKKLLFFLALLLPIGAWADEVTTTTWAVTSTDDIPAGTKYELDNITLTIGEAGSNDFAVNKWVDPYDETFKNLICGNEVNGHNEGGTFYLFTPKKNGNLTVVVRQNVGGQKKFYVEESGRVMDDFNGILPETDESTYRGPYTIPVFANLTYKIYCAGSKMGFYGFTFESRNDADKTNITFADKKVKALCVANWDTNKDGELSLAEAAAVTDISGVFYFNKEITSFDELRFFTGLTSLSFGALNECFELKSVCIPANIVEMDGGAFASCHNLEYIGVDASNPKFKSYGDNNAVIERAANRLVVGCPDAIIPDNITTIGKAAFWGHSGEWKDIPASVTKIDEGAFAYGGLNAVNISANVEYIGESAFRCNGLWEVVIPAKVTYIGKDAFNECDRLGKVTVLNPNPIELINAETFNNRAYATLIVPAECKAAYMAADHWKDFGMITEGLVGEEDWADCGEFNSYEGTGATCARMADGLTINNPKVQTDMWTPGTVICRGDLTLKKDHYYKVRLTMKVPSDGTYSVVIGGWYPSQGHEFHATASDDFQVFEFEFPEYEYNLVEAHVRILTGWVAGPTIVKNVQVLDVTNGETLLAEKDWTSPYEFWAKEGTGASCTMVPDGVAITNPRVQSENTDIQTMVLKGATLQENHSYKVTVEAKIPSDGNIQVLLGNADYYQEPAIPVTASDDFQTIEVLFQDFPQYEENAFVKFQNGGIKGTSIVRFIQVIDLGNIPVPLKYKYNPDEGTAKVIKDPDRNYKEAVVIPSTIEHNGINYTVTEISDDAFTHCAKLTSITIPATVTKLYGSSFIDCPSLQQIVVNPNNPVYDSRNNCNAVIHTENNELVVGSLKTVIPKGVTRIGNDAFFGHWPLEYIKIPNSVKEIGENAFAYCFLKEMTLPSGIETIEGRAFWYTDLPSIILPASLKTIGDGAFSNCPYLTSVVIPDGLEEIPNECFKECTKLESIDLKNVKKIGDGAFTSCPITAINLGKVEKVGHGAFMSTAIEELTIPATLTEVGIESFSWNFCMKKATFQNGCTKVFDTMFHGNENLSEVILPNTITEIQDRAFQSCAKLENVAWPNKLERIGEQAFRLSGITSAVLPVSMKWIGNQAFQYCNQLAGYVDLASIEHLGYNAFSDCPLITMTSIPPTIVIDENSWAAFSPSGLETVEFFEGTTRIDNLTFAGCENLKNLPYGLPSTLESIGHNAFTECKSLESVTIPQNVNWIQEEAFKDCSKLTSVISRIPDPTNMTFEKDVFTGISKNAVLYVPKGTISAYTKKGWAKYFAKVVEEPANTLYPKELSTRAGKQPTLAIAMDNNSKITAMQFDLVLPEGITVATDEDGMIITLGSRAATSHTVAKRIQNDGSVRIVCSSNSSAVFSGNTGSVVFVKLNVDSKVADGDYDVTVRNIELSSDNGVAFHPDQASATITVGGIIMGDVDYNGSVTVNDAVWIVRRILNNTPEGFVEAAADLDGNGSISINDKVVLINRYILGKNKAATRAASADDNATLSLADFNMKPGETRTIEVMMSTTRTDIEALQCDIYLPEGLEFVAKEDGGEKFYAEKGGRATNSHSISSYIQEDGALRVVESNDEGTAFRQNDKPVFTITVKANDDVKVGKHTIRLTNIELSYGQPINPAEVKSTVTISIDNLGDVNNDGKVNQSDISALAELIMNGTYNARADMNKDGIVNAVDLVLLTNEIK